MFMAFQLLFGSVFLVYESNRLKDVDTLNSNQKDWTLNSLKLPENCDCKQTLLNHCKAICCSVATASGEPTSTYGNILLAAKNEEVTDRHDEIVGWNSTQIPDSVLAGDQGTLDDQSIVESLIITAKNIRKQIEDPDCIVQVQVCAQNPGDSKKYYYAQAIFDEQSETIVAGKSGIR